MIAPLLRYAHIVAGLLTLACGLTAMIAVKGSRVHRSTGTVFCGAMLVLAATGVIIAVRETGNMGNILGGITAFYMVLTAWATVLRPPATTGRFEVFAAGAGFVLGSGAAIGGLVASQSTGNRLFGYPPVFYVVFAMVLLTAAVMDARMLARGGVTGAARTSRHLIRVSLAFFMATGSFFFGQRQFVPKIMLDTGTYVAAAFFPLVMLVFWLVRVRLWPLARRQAMMR